MTQPKKVGPVLAILALLPQFKKDRTLLAFAILLLVCTGAAVRFKYLTVGEAEALIVGALALPGLWGRSKENEAKKGDAK